MASNATQLAVWWGAGVGTLAIVWDVVKWLASGPRVGFTVRTNMLVINNPFLEGKSFWRPPSITGLLPQSRTWLSPGTRAGLPE